MVPASLRPGLGRVEAALGGYRHWCPVCGRRVRRFLSIDEALPELMEQLREHRFDLQLFWQAETLNMDQYACPHCRANDRSRLYALFLRQHAEMIGDRGRPRMLDIAPSKPLQRFILALDCFEYRTADLLMDDVDDRIDLSARTPYVDGRFDCLICSHVVEHVADDRGALRELRRIVRPGGWGIIMAPVCLSLRQTIEDLTLADPAERIRRFGQADHLRLYAKADFISRLSAAGFSVEAQDVKTFGSEAFRRAGITQTSVLYVCGNPG